MRKNRSSPPPKLEGLAIEIPVVQEQEGMLLAESFGGLREEVEEEQPVRVVLLAWPLRSLFSLVRPCDSFTNNTNLFLSLVSGLVRESNY